MNRGQRRRAEKIAVKSQPSAAAAQFFAQAVRRQVAGALGEACAAYTKGLALQPDHAEAHYALGLALHHLRKFDQAIDCYSRAVVHDPRHASAFNNLCDVWCSMGEIEKAIAAGRRAVALAPNVAVHQHNLAEALSRDNQRDNSEECLARYRFALSLDPHLAAAHMGLGVQLLNRGDFAQGWEEYEWRWRLKPWAWIRECGLSVKSRWEGEEIADKTLLICAEQGLGDTIQFVRYLPLVLAKAKRVIFWVQPELKALFRNLEGATLVGRDNSIDGVDVYCPLLSLPRIFGIRAETIPPVGPCIRSDSAAVARWRSRLGQGGFRVGISWQGTPGTAVDRGRSIPLASFAPLARIPGVRLISLQKNFGTEQLADLPEGMKVETLGDDFDVGSGAFLDAAAAMESLDLVITSDTAIAHLAGSLGRPTWTALKRFPDWRWGVSATASPWYPSMLLFRQTTTGDWDGVVQEIAAALAPRVAEVVRAEEGQTGFGRSGRR